MGAWPQPGPGQKFRGQKGGPHAGHSDCQGSEADTTHIPPEGAVRAPSQRRAGRGNSLCSGTRELPTSPHWALLKPHAWLPYLPIPDPRDRAAPGCQPPGVHRWGRGQATPWLSTLICLWHPLSDQLYNPRDLGSGLPVSGVNDAPGKKGPYPNFQNLRMGPYLGGGQDRAGSSGWARNLMRHMPPEALRRRAGGL